MEIRNFLLECGVYPNLNGYSYLIDAVKIVKQNPNIKISRQVYPMIARMHKTTATKVERAIRHIVSTRISKEEFEKIGIKKAPNNGELIWFFAIEGGKNNG